MNSPAENSTNATPRDSVSRAAVERWRAEATDFFVQVRRELSCLTGEAPRTPTQRSAAIETVVEQSVHAIEQEVNDLLPASDAATDDPTPEAPQFEEPLPTAADASNELHADPSAKSAPDAWRESQQPPKVEKEDAAAPSPGSPSESEDAEAERLAVLKRQIAEKLGQASGNSPTVPAEPPERG